ncbi:methyltransferase family protein [Pseudonocardia hierapolitana]|uniref:Methyltransferase family protein n=1 Tax=Pseudonocardia hierapolitana TaxID=1128676 RepID=A0A561T5L0_9PSEU|nr:class I SAM-dependent methyltransferase [Pseudonocardia hierapolitana]TWF82393.1 methyltransferase family protein [Pseudonocardia hierapolitana]
MCDPIARLFDLIADGYDEDVPFYATIGRLLVQWAEPAADARVLDIGAGRGAITRALAESRGAAGSIVAGDISPRMLEQLAALQLPGVETRLLDARRLDLPDASFDMVFAGFVLSAIPDPARAIAELARVLRPGGQMLLSAPGPCSADEWWVRYGEIVDEFTARVDSGLAPEAEAVPVSADVAADAPAHTHDDVATELERIGLRPVAHTHAEVELPIDGPEAYWRWLQMHGNQWIHDALSEPDRAEFRDRVLDSLQNLHPAHGKRLIAGAVFERLERV